MVLVIFVIMLLNLTDEKRLKEKFNFRIILAILFGIAFVAQIAFISFAKNPLNVNLHQNSATIGTAQSIGTALYTNYLVPFEVVGILLVVAIIGAIVLAKRKVN